MKLRSQRFTAFFLVAVMIASALPFGVFAADNETPTQNSDGVYQLGSAEDLFWFAETVNKTKYTSAGGWSKEAWINAELTADIDLADAPWTPIGTAFYAGHFNGNGFTISGLNITADSDEDMYVGFFADAEEAVIENLKLSGTVTVTENSTADSIGGIAGYVYDGELKNCRADIEITVEGSNAVYIGGLFGIVEGETSTIQYCAHLGDISTGSAVYVGGLIGYSCCEDELSISYCYQKGGINAETGIVGGLIGESDDSTLTVKRSYVSASIGDEILPSGLEQTGIITGELAGDLFGLLGVGSFSFDGAYCINEIAVGDGSYTIYELDETSCPLCSYYGTSEDFLEDLNGGDDGSAFAAAEDGDGWPVLAWELKDGASPDQQAKELVQAKEAAKAEIAALFTDTYKEADYEAADWAKMTSYRDNAITAVEAAQNIDSVNAVLGTLKVDLQSVPNATSRLDGYKEAARTAIEKAYYYQVVGTYSTTETGYKTDLVRYIETAEKFGLMHDLKEQLLEELNKDLATLESTKNKGLASVNTAATKADVDTEQANAISAMEQVLKTAESRTPDNGVADKWDGTTKTQPIGSGTEASPYQIGNGAELAWFADKVNSGSKNLYATLTADIDLNGKAWTPISKSTDDGNAYVGVFDGNGHRIHGLAVTVEKEDGRFHGGLFGNIGKNGVVKNISVAGVIKQMLGNSSMSAIEKTKYSVGGIAGRSCGVVYNCESSVVLTNGTTYSNCNYFGGIVGYQAGGIIESCTAYAVLYKNGTANFQSGFGGVAGYSNGNSLIRYTDSYAYIDLGGNVLSNIGGIVGTLAGRAQIRECRHFGTVVNGSGIAGNVLEQAGITYALNSGTVSGENGIGESGIRPAAGIIGVLNSTGTVSYIYNNGTCKYGLVNNFKKGTIIHAQSSTDVSLWGTADAQNAFTDDCLKVDEIEMFESTESTGDFAWAKLEATAILLDKLKSSTDSTYGTQSTEYNAVVLQFIRKVELAEDTDEINSVLSEAARELNTVQTQLEAEKANVIAAFEKYVAERVYGEAELAQIKTLLEKAKEAANSATTLTILGNVREEYLGTNEQPGKFETECDTYNTKAKNELYNEFIYEKKYSNADMAAMLSLYEMWAVRIDTAASVEKVDTVFADARFALNEAALKLTETDVAPDMDAAANAAFALAKEEAEKELKELAKAYKSSLKALVDSTGGKGYADGILSAIQKVETSHSAYMDVTAAVDFDSLTDYAQIEEAKNNAASVMEDYAAKAVNQVWALIDEANRTSDTLWDGETVTEPTKDEDDIYQISTGAELAWFAEQVNKGSFANGKANAVLTQDIDLGYNEWTPIGIGLASGKAFAGTFDGNGHTIKGLYFSKANDSGCYGLFGAVRSGTVIKELTVKGSFRFDEVGNAYRIGGIAATATYGNTTLKNCVSYVDIEIDKITNTAGAPSYVGGLVGYVHYSADTVSITDSAFKGSVSVRSCNTNVSGIGGIIGITEANIELVRTVNYGDICVDKAVGVGGIVGEIYYYGYPKTATITDCANLGNIKNDADNVLDSKGGTGGIVGVSNGYNATVSGCYNTGIITASKLAGGIFGSVSASNSTVVLENCYNAGTLVGPNNQTASKIGSLVGYPLDGEYKDGLFVLKGTAQAAMGWKSSHGDRIYVVTAEELIKQFADGTNMVESIADLNRGYPLFAWQLLDNDNRKAVIDYLNNCFENDIKNFASAKQKAAILKVLEEQSSAILKATDANTVITAYETAMTAMEKKALLSDAKKQALQELENTIAEYISEYPNLADEINALKSAVKSDIETAQSPSEIDIALDKTDASVVDLLIEDIGEINNDITEEQAETVKQKIALAEAAYNGLSDTQKQLVSKFVKLSEAKSALNAYANAYAADKAAADKVAESIKAIGEVTLDSKAVIEAALNGYNALTDKQKALISTDDYNLLTAAQTRYNELVAAYNTDVKAANNVISLINAIGTVTLDSKEAIDTANEAYNSLSDSQKAMISAATYDTLQNAIAKYDELLSAYTADRKAVQAVVDKINAIGTVTLDSQIAIEAAINSYNALTDSQKQMLSEEDYNTMQTASDEFRQLLSAYNADVDAATAVVDKINAIGTVTLDSKEAIDTANEAYNSLSDSQKAMISAATYDTLQNAIAKYDELLSAYTADRKAVQAVVDKINAIGTVTLDSQAAITAARADYNALTASQKKMISADVLNILAFAEAQYDALVKADADNSHEDMSSADSEDSTGCTLPSEDTTSEEDETSAPDNSLPSDDTSDVESKPVSTASPKKSVDLGFVWVICAIAAVALIAFGLIRWFAVANSKKRK